MRFQFRSDILQAAILASVVCANLCSCSLSHSDPVLYPNEHLRQVTLEQSKKEIAECRTLADQYVKDSDRLNQIARESTTGAVVGSAAGALAGVITGGGVGRAVGAGAAVGAIVPILQSAFEAHEVSPTYQRFMEICLSNKGYQVLSWN